MWTLLGLIIVSFNVAHASENDTFLLPDLKDILSFGYSGGVSSPCKEHIEEYQTGVEKKEFWALQMIDSITKFPDGIFVGHILVPGVFDECVNAANEKFTGKHCMPKITFKVTDEKSFLSNIYNRKSQKQMGGNQMQFSYGICIPSTCNSTDLINLFDSVKESFDFLKDIQVNVTEADCSTKDFRPFRTEDWVTVAVLIIILLMALGSTAYDLIQRFIHKIEIPHKLWSSFSIYTNGKYLVTVSQSSAQLKCLHGIRFLSMSWVILCHSYFSFLLGAPFNMSEIPNFMNDKSFMPVSNGFVSVDSFFFLSGLLVCLVFFRDISKKKTFDVPVAFIHRYMRLTPPFALLMLIQSTIISRMGNGPFWNQHIDAAEKQCRESWWSGIIYLQNYLKPKSMCLGQAWYLSADMQMYWVSPLILYPMLWFPSFAPFFITILVLAAASTNFAIAYVNKLSPNFLMNWGVITMDQFQLEYVPFHTRMAPWLIGLATGYIICGIQAKKIRINLSKFWVIVGWVAALGLLGGSIFGVSRFIGKKSDEYTQLESSMYLAFHRVGWALGMGWVVIACIAGYGGPINGLLSLDFFQPLAKLSYCNFLIHMTIQNYRINTSRLNQYLRHFDVVYAFFGDLLISHIIAIPIVLLFEFPFSNIDRHFFQKLVIFPLPKPQKEKKNEEKEPREETVEKQVESSDDVEKGKVNPAFSEK